MTPTVHAIAELLSLGLLDSLLQGAVICLLVGMVLRIAPRQNAATRFAIWFSALVAVAVLPWIDMAWPQAALGGAAAKHAAITLPNSWAVYFVGFWGFVALWFCVRLVRSFRYLNTVRRNCAPVKLSELDPVVRETLRRHGAKRGISLCASADVRVPAALGLLRPAIVIPNWAMKELSPTEINQLLLHELAHFRRWDDWTNLAQQFVKALFFFHPAVWWIDNRVTVEREMACDDEVLAETPSPRAYAECLAHLAEKSFMNRAIALAQAALGKISQTSDRVAEILNVNRPLASSRSSRLAVWLVAALAVVCVVSFSRTPKLVAFEGTSLPHSIAAATVSPISHYQDVQRVPLVPVLARLNRGSVARRPSNLEQAVALHTNSSNSRKTTKSQTRHPERNLVHLAAAKSAPVPVTEMFLMVVESSGSNPAAPELYQIQMWRVTVLRTVIAPPDHPIPAKEI